MSKKCPKCTKSVYAAEWVQASGQFYHKTCFKCTTCNSALTVGKQKEKDDKVYCEGCFNKNFPVTGAGAKAAAPTTSSTGDNCPVCNKAVYQAEQVKTEIAKYHPTCFNCYECKTRLLLGKQKEKDDSLYCEACFIKKYPVTGAGAAVSAPASSSTGDNCPVCNKAVYQAEQVKTEIAKYHPTCFNCYECKTPLVLGKQKEKDNSVFCELCFVKKYPVTGSGAAVSAPASSSTGDTCPVCSKAVYQGEQVKTEIAKYHPECFKCYECKTQLTLGKQKEKDNSLFCEKCFLKKYPITGAGATAVKSEAAPGE